MKGTIVKIDNNTGVVSLDKDKGFLDKNKIEKVPLILKKFEILGFIFIFLFIKGVLKITRKNKKLLGIQGD